MADDANGNDKERYDPSRRRFIKNTGFIAGGVVGGSLLGGLFTSQWQSQPELGVSHQGDVLQEARVFFTREDDFKTLAAATERIFPEDEHAPGAIALAIPYFIDKQLATFWGSNAHSYMKGPFLQNNFVREYEKQDSDRSKQGRISAPMPSIPTPRYQTRLNRGDIFQIGIKKMREESETRHGMAFDKLEPEQQDEILTAFENNDIKLPGVSAETFFNLLLQTTIEGAYADPVYGGNKNMDGWRMKEYPGPRAAYINDIESEEFIQMEPKSLKDYQGH
jgi:gluconate 2-dehydrogenase gamma chain